MPRGLDGLETKIIEDQQVRTQVGVEAAVEAAVRASRRDQGVKVTLTALERLKVPEHGPLGSRYQAWNFQV